MPSSDQLTLQLHHRSDQELLALVASGRAKRAGPDWQIAKDAWRNLAARNYDRVRGLVVTFSFPGSPNVRIAPTDYDDAAQECFIRTVKMLGNFRGTTLAEFSGALRTCVANTCMDFCRRQLSVERGIAGSLDEPLLSLADDSSGRFDADLAHISMRQNRDQASAREALASLSVALDRLTSDRMREVLRRRMTGASSKEIAAELGLTVANVDQLCSRGIKKLKEVSA